jgi:hypothetical protein
VSNSDKTILRALKVGDPCIVVTTTGYRTNDPETRTPATVASVGRRWMTVAGSVYRFDRDDGFNNTTGNYRGTPRVSTQVLLDAQARHGAASRKVRDALMSHGWWTGDALSTKKLERIAAILEEREPVP